MPEHATVSIYESTRGALNTLLEEEGCECFQAVKLLTYFSGALLDYVEEGRPINPRILLCSSIENFARSIPGALAVTLGDEVFREELGRGILKRAASLAGDGGIIFIETAVGRENVSYGILSTHNHPTALSPYEAFEAISPARDGFSILLERRDARQIGFIGGRGNKLDVSFATFRETANSDAHVRNFAKVALSGLEISADQPDEVTDDRRSETEDYLTKCIERCLARTHGTILICCDSAAPELVDLKDAVSLSPSIDLASSFLAFRADNEADSLLEIQRAERLLTGLMSSDGIVVFDRQGKVTAFRVFYRPVDAPSSSQAESGSKSGGARRRAYDGVCALVGSGIEGAMFRSQDGTCDFKGKSN